jgi:hypothetical protein
VLNSSSRPGTQRAPPTSSKSSVSDAYDMAGPIEREPCLFSGKKRLWAMGGSGRKRMDGQMDEVGELDRASALSAPGAGTRRRAYTRVAESTFDRRETDRKAAERSYTLDLSICGSQGESCEPAASSAKVRECKAAISYM